jgi:hypothetical protein
MTRVRDVLICFGVFWLSEWLIAPFGWLFGRLADRIIFEDGVLGAIALGIMLSLGRAFAAVVAGALATLTVSGRKPERWLISLRCYTRQWREGATIGKCRRQEWIA